MKSALLLLACLLLTIALVATADEEPEVPKFESAGACATHCALNNFNKFDHDQFNQSGACRCYNDQAELEFNNRHGTLRSKILAAQ